eukprot:TRINITY_DN1265_c0_g1_i1.p1 TRINITY_DN1265_c0_g1~~TRINITY_DN1265_c0_g1_i1.p1  ORF type:complete len:122 (+),score=15.50 TRINITY_DN1265_c0_g1_i1:131-496(+)
MEFPDLGAHCDKKDCKQLDFLPFRCEGCQKKFCLEHRKLEDHDCEHANKVLDKKKPPSISCPLCSVPVYVPPGANIDNEVVAHIERGCKPNKINSHACSFPKCKEKEPFLVFAATVKNSSV